MKKLIFLITLMTASAYAHDGGHGPKLGDQPKYGGKVAAVINKKEVKKGTDAKLLYKAELTKNSQNIIRVYMYNTKMKLMNLNNLKNAKADLIFKDRKTKKWKAETFNLEKKDDFYQGKLPVQPRRPFNIDVTVNAEGKDLFMAFDNLN